MNEDPNKPSDAKIAANRENAKKSTGPKTPAGKAVSSTNSLVHWMYARRTVVVGPPLREDPAQFLFILEGLRADLEPVGVLEDILVQEVAESISKGARAVRSETAGIAERLVAAMVKGRKEIENERWNVRQKGLELGSVHDPRERPIVTSQLLRETIDMADRLEHDQPSADDEGAFHAWVMAQQRRNGGDGQQPKSATPEDCSALLPPSTDTGRTVDLKLRFSGNTCRRL